MKVLLLNGSRREHQVTCTALNLVAEELNAAGIDTEIVYVGLNAVNGNLNALVKDVAEKCKEIDGLVIGAPVYYASPTGEIQVFLDRLFGVARKDLVHKPCAVLTSARRGGTAASLDVLAKYPGISEMPLVSSSYWNMIFGNTPEEAKQDAEGVFTMRTLGRNMARLLQCIEAGKKAGIPVPAMAEPTKTNFIR